MLVKISFRFAKLEDCFQADPARSRGPREAQDYGVSQTEEYVPWLPVDVMQTLVIGLQQQMPDWARPCRNAIGKRGRGCREHGPGNAMQSGSELSWQIRCPD